MSKNKTFKWPLSLKIFLAILLIVTVQSIMLFWSTSQQYKKSANAEVEEDIRALLINYQQNLEYMAKNRAFEEIQKNITALGVQTDIEQAVLLDNKQKIIASTHIEDIGKKLSDLYHSSSIDKIMFYLDRSKSHYKNILWHSDDKKTLYAIAPVVLGRLSNQSIHSDKIGAMLLRIDMGWVDRKNQELLKSTLLPDLLLILLTGLGLVIYFHFSINRRIKTISHAATEFSKNNHGIRIPVSGRDELTDLSISFNNMAKEVQEQHKTIIEREKNLSVTLNSIGDAVIATDAQGNVTRLNPVAEQLTGWTINEARGKSVKTIFPIVDATTRKPIDNPVDKVISTGEIVYLSNHTTLISKDKTEYQIADSAAPIRDNGEIQGMILVFNDVTEKYQLRENLKQQQKTLQDVLDGMQSLVGILNLQGEFLFTNSPAVKLSGLQYSEILGSKFWTLAPFNHNPEVQQQIISDFEAAREGRTRHRDIAINTIKGAFWIDFSIQPVFDENNKISHIIIEGHDINQRRKMEQEIRSYSQHLMLYREQSPLATIEWNTKFEIIGWNNAAEKIFGYSYEEAYGKTTQILLPCDVKIDVEKIWQDLVDSNQPSTSTNENLTKDNQIILCEWHTSLLKNEADEAIGAISIVQDITREKRAIQALEQKELEQREILDSMVDGVISIDECGTVLSFNKSAETLFGYTANEMIGQNVNMLMPEPDASQHNAYLKNYIKTGIAKIIGTGLEVTAKHKEGKTFPMRLMVAELSSDSSGKRRFIASCHDLSHFKHQEEIIQRTQKMDALGKLTGGIAHDYNNMLGVILGYAEILQNALNDQHPKLSTYAQQIYSAGERGAKLTQKLLSFSRKKVTETQEVNINNLLEDSRNMLEKTLTPRIKLIFNLDKQLWPVKLDTNDLEDTILNISINAMHAIDSNGQLTIRTHNEHITEADAQKLQINPGDYVVLSMTDTGHGMAEEIKQKIFDPFFSTKGDKGTGLGLSQVYGFVERSGGTIKVYSEPGHGSQFILYFPRHVDSNEENRNNTVKEPTSMRGGENILIVDDEPALLDLIDNILSQQGYQTFTANNAQQALDILEKEKIDLLISDVIMPDMDGYELASIVQKQYPHIKIQLASGFSDDRHIKMADTTLHKNLLHKPYNSQELLARVRSLLD